MDQGISVGAGFLLSLAVARTATKESYGLFVLSYSLFTLLTSMHNAIVVEPFTVLGAGKFRPRFSSYLAWTWKKHFWLCVILSSFAFAGWFIGKTFHISLGDSSFLGLALATTPLLTAIWVRRISYVVDRPDQAAVVSLIFAFVAVCAAFPLFVQGKTSGFVIYMVLLAAWTAGILPIARRPENAAVQNPGELFQEPHLHYAKWVLATALVFQLTSQGYYWLVAGMLSVREVAEFRAAYNLVIPVDLAFGSISLLLLPRMAQLHADGAAVRFNRLLGQYLALRSAGSILFALIVALFGSNLMNWLYGGKFDSSVPLIIVLCFVPLFMGIGNSFNDALKALERPSAVFYAYCTSGLATLTIGLPLIHFLGIRGAAWGMLISASIYSITMCIHFIRAPKRSASGFPLGFNEVHDF